ncbi:MAG: lysophospholipid acyltransferase family protein [Gemmataceae bacterium]
MEPWHYDPAAYLDEGFPARLQSLLSEPGLLVHGVRSLAAAALRGWLRLYHRLTIIGRHNLPADRSFILLANHASHLDTLCLLSALPIHQLRRAFPAAAKDYFCVSAARAFLARVFVNVLPFERHLAPWLSLSTCAHLLQTPGNVLILFPEGTRGSGNEAAEFKPGVALLAAGHDIPVVPCHLAGTHAALPKGSFCPRPRAIRLTIGTPRVYAHLPPTKESARHICRELRETVIQLGNANEIALSFPRRNHEL